jgi:CubicO group peptidase (beta-lactamase class C family)
MPAIVMLLLLLSGPLVSAQNLYFPAAGPAWEHVEPAAAGWNKQAVLAALDLAGARHSTAVVILHKGKLMAERQWDLAQQKTSARFQFERTSDGQILEDVASAQKSVTAILVGIARHKALLSLDDPVAKYLGTGWSKASREQESRITIRHLATMSSGLTEALAYEAEPGTKWFYNTVAYQQLLRVLEKAAGKDINELTREWLTGPIGMQDSLWRGRGMGLMGFLSTARDLARFGLLIEAGGVWNGRPIVEDTRYLAECLRPSQEMNPAYGYLWWLNGHPVKRPQRPNAPKLIPSAPDDLVAALGAMGRKVYVVRSLNLVVTRTGDTPDAPGQESFDEAFWKLLMKAAPGQRGQ